jgi:hypothetical protein
MHSVNLATAARTHGFRSHPGRPEEEEDLKKSFRKNQKTWRRLLEHVPQG